MTQHNVSLWTRLTKTDLKRNAGEIARWIAMILIACTMIGGASWAMYTEDQAAHPFDTAVPHQVMEADGCKVWRQTTHAGFNNSRRDVYIVKGTDCHIAVD